MKTITITRTAATQLRAWAEDHGVMMSASGREHDGMVDIDVDDEVHMALGIVSDDPSQAIDILYRGKGAAQ